MTHREEEALRRALHAAADSLDPAADGLTRIRARLSPPRPLGLAWVIALWAALAGFATLRLEPAFGWLGERVRPALGALRTWFSGTGARHRRHRVWRHRRHRAWWQQPLVAIAAVVVIAAAAGISLSGLPSEISQDTTQSQTSHEGGRAGGGQGSGLNGAGQPYAPGTGKHSKTASPPAPGTPSASSTKAGGATPSPLPPSPTPSLSPSASPTPTQSPSPTPTPTPSPSDSADSGTGNPGPSGS